MEKPFPENYPSILEEVSWSLGEIAGPHKWWSKYLDPSCKCSPYFWKNACSEIIKAAKLKCSKEMLDYILKSFTLYFKDDMFMIGKKKDKAGQRVFSEEEWHKLCDEEGISRRDATHALKTILQESKNAYNAVALEGAKKR